MRAGYETAAGHAPLVAMPSTAPCKSSRARVRRIALSADQFDFLDCTARHSAVLIFVFDTRGLPTGSRFVQWAVLERALPSV